MPEPTDPAQAALLRFVRSLALRRATGASVLAVEMTQEMCASGLESAAAGQDEAEVSDVQFSFTPGAAALSARVRVRGRAWPPRPPVDTRVSLGISDVVVSSEGPSGRLMFRVAEPLAFTSVFADALLGLLSFLGGPERLEALRRKGGVVTIDFAELVRAARPDLAPMAQLVRLTRVELVQGRVRMDIGFNYG